MPIQLKERAYGPESSKDDIAALREQVYLFEPGVVMYREAPVITMYQLDVYHRKLDELSTQLGDYQMVIDISETKGPNAEQRARLKKMYGSQKNLRGVAVFTGKNFVINVVARFVLSGLGLKTFSVHKTLEEAVGALRDGSK